MLRKTTILSMMILLALSCGLSACSSSDDPANPGGFVVTVAIADRRLEDEREEAAHVRGLEAIRVPADG